MSVPYHTLIHPTLVYTTVPRPPPAQGWQCPVCHGVYAPFVPQCFRCCNQAGRALPATDSASSWQPIEWNPAPGISVPHLGPENVMRKAGT